jgi:LCP family protein required for cell wall assembly
MTRRRSKSSDVTPVAKVDEHGLAPLPPLGRSRHRRTWPQRLVLSFNSLVAFVCIAAAGTLIYANNRYGDRRLVDISSAAAELTTTTTIEVPDSAAPTSLPGETTSVLEEIIVPEGDVGAKNFLLTASDNRECIDPNSPYAGAFLGNGSDIGERADTIMMLRIDSATKQAAVLSFPRDLWVKIGDSSRKSRINSALDKNDPLKIVKTISNNFGLSIDHLINVDFCAFKGLVEAVGGVAVPFEFAARDKATGLNIAQPECHLFLGDEALAYVRSRKYQYFDPEKNSWVSDGTSDLGRITRQQDFLKRTLQKALDKGASDIRVAKKLIDTAIENVVTDSNLTLDVMLQVANAMKDFDPATVQTFQIEATPRTIAGNAVLEPRLGSDRMEAVLSVFRGEARLADLATVPTADPNADPNASTTTIAGTTVDGTTTTTPATSTSRNGTSTTTSGGPTTTLPIVVAEENLEGLYPPRDLSCR